MKISKKLVLFPSITLLLANCAMPAFARSVDDIMPGKYSYSGIFIDEKADFKILKGIGNEIEVYDPADNAMALIKNAASRDADGNRMDIVLELKNFREFNQCAIEKVAKGPYVNINLYPLTSIHPDAGDNAAIINLHSYCAGADFIVSYYKANTVNEATGVGIPATVKNASLTVFGLDDSGNERDFDYENNSDIANYGEERLIVKAGAIDPILGAFDEDYVSIENNTISALTLDPTADMSDRDYSASAVIDDINNQFSTYFSARNGSIGISMSTLVAPYHPEAPIKSVNKTEADAGEDIEFTIRQNFPAQVYNYEASGAYLLFDNFYGDGALPQNLKITDSDGEDVTDGVTIWTLPSNNDYLPNDTFYFFCNIDMRKKGDPICFTDSLPAKEFFLTAANDNENFLKYFADKINMPSDELLNLIESMNDEYSLDDFFESFNATKKAATSEIDISGQNLTISYTMKMPAETNELNSQVALLNAMIDTFGAEIGNTVTVRTRKGIDNPATADSIAKFTVVASAALFGAFFIIKKTTARR